jgi:hypothetical protein
MSKDVPKCCLAISMASFSISVNVSTYSSGVGSGDSFGVCSFDSSILYFFLLKRIFNLLYMERGLTMVLHSVIIGIILYLLMIYGLNQPKRMAENRSILIAAIVLIYMILFGHGLPRKINI